MARMPRGEPRSVPDPAGDLYDREMAKIRARRKAEDLGLPSPLDLLGGALADFQRGPRIPRPTTGQTFIPVVGPGWEAVADLQDGDYAGAAFNGAVAATGLLPVGVTAKGLHALSKGVGAWKSRSVTAEASRKVLRGKGFARPGQEIHHTVPLKGLGRNVQDWRNHYAFLKVLPKEQHRRLTGKWDGKPRYDPIRRVWYGTTDWMKAWPTGIAGYLADVPENPQGSQPPLKPRR